MRLSGVELRRVSLPLRRPFRSAHGVVDHRDVLFVTVHGDEGEGTGECAAPALPGYTDEHLQSAHDVLRQELVPRLLAAADVTAESVGPALATVTGHRMAKASLEMAVLDAELRAAGVALARHLGGTRDWVEAGVAIGIPGSLADLLDQVTTARDEGYRRVKLKIEPGWDVAPVEAVRAAFGDGLVLQVDANGAYRLSDAEHLARLDAFGLAMLEQPFPADAAAEHAELARRLRTPICLDESVTSAADATRLIALGAAAVVNVKASRVGGYLEAARVHDACRAADTPAWCGGMLEAGVGRAANLALASLPGFTLPGDLTPPERHLACDVAEPLVRDGARLRVPTLPGIGAALLADVVAERTVSVEYLAAPGR